MKPRINSFVRFSTLITAAWIAFAASASAADFTWDGGTGNWTDINWNGASASGPTTAGNTATINSGNVTANVGGPGNVDSITLGSGSQLNLSNSAYGYFGNLILQGGTVSGSGNYNAYGAAIFGNVTVNGSAASTILGSSFFNLSSTSTFTVADATGDANTDLLVTTSLRGPTGSPDYTYNTAKLVKEGAGTMEVTVHSYFRGGLDLNGGALKVSGGNGGYGFFDGTVNVNSGTTLETVSDGTGLGWQSGWKPAAVNISGGTITTAGVSHIWGISGGINMTGGTLQSNNGVSDPNGGQLEWNYTDVTTNASADTATIGGRIRIRGDGGYSGISFNVANGAAATDLLVSAAVTEASSGLGITKSGSGTMVLSGSNNYTGSTTVSAGTLLVNGSLGNSAVSVASNATVGGSGAIGGSLSFAENSLFDVFSAVMGSNPLAVAGTVTFGSGFGIDNLTGINWSSVGVGTYTLIDSVQDFSIAGLDNWGSSNALSVGAGKSAYFNNGSLQLVVVPEPSAALLGGLGLLALLRRRR
jgi:fibronectin-binding autotransporter adhesin